MFKLLSCLFVQGKGNSREPQEWEPPLPCYSHKNSLKLCCAVGIPGLLAGIVVMLGLRDFGRASKEPSKL